MGGRLRSLAGLLVVAAALYLVGAGAAIAADAAVTAEDFSFAPKTVTVSVGDTVTWTNVGHVGHTVTARDGSFHKLLPPDGGTASVTLDTEGTFDYFCRPHTWMVGTVVVQTAAAGGSGSGGTTPPTDTDGTYASSAGAMHAWVGVLLVAAALTGFAAWVAVARRRTS